VRSEPPAADSASAPSQSDRPAPSSHSDAGDSVDDPAAVSAELPREQAAHVRPSKPTTKPSGIREFFLLSSAEDAESALGGDSAAFRKLFDRAERRAEAAISLWNAGIYPEAYSLLSSACDALREMDERFASLRALTGPMGTLRMTLPSESLEDKVTAEAQREFDERREQLTVAIGALRGVALGKSRRAWIRTQRLLVSMLFALAIGGGVGKFLNRITLTANASASYNLTQYPPKNAIDGDYSTNWLLTDGTAGWIEVAFRKRNVNAIRLYNVRGLVRYGAADTNIEFYLNGRVVRSMPVNLRPTVNSLEPFRVPLVGSIQADKIRFNIQAFHDLGGGLAEIEVE
jgi:hypothetical protein